MKKDKHKTKVIFRKFKEGDVIALFPEELGTNEHWTCNSYQHIGQHSSCCADTIVYCTKLATPEEYEDLYNELESIGYNLEIRKRVTQHMDQIRYEKSHS